MSATGLWFRLKPKSPRARRSQFMPRFPLPMVYLPFAFSLAASVMVLAVAVGGADRAMSPHFEIHPAVISIYLNLCERRLLLPVPASPGLSWPHLPSLLHSHKYESKHVKKTISFRYLYGQCNFLIFRIKKILLKNMISFFLMFLGLIIPFFSFFIGEIL